MRRNLLIFLTIVLTGCNATTSQPETTTTSALPGSTTTTAAPTTTETGPPLTDAEVAWTEVEAEKHVANYLAALAAGAFAQAGFSAENNGIVVDGQTSSETVVAALARMCAEGACAGPYSVEANGPGLVDPETAQASSTVTVTHNETGDVAEIEVATFEGQIIIADVPPLVPGNRGRSLVEALFEDDIPNRVVVERFQAFEIWDRSQPTWVTNWWADQASQVEGNLLSLIDGVVTIDDPSLAFESSCPPRLMPRGSELLVLEQCDTGGWSMYEAYTGDPRPTPIEFVERTDGEYLWFAERGGAVVTGIGDAEGNLISLTSEDGTDLLGDDYASLAILSTDGSRIAYVDHADPDASSHFWSPVVVVKDLATGEEVARWNLGNPILYLEFSGDWVVAAEIDPAAIGTETIEQIAVNALNVATGAATRVETPTRVFLPS